MKNSLFFRPILDKFPTYYCIGTIKCLKKQHCNVVKNDSDKIVMASTWGLWSGKILLSQRQDNFEKFGKICLGRGWGAKFSGGLLGISTYFPE